MISGSASLTNMPAHGVTSAMNLPSASTALRRQVVLLADAHVVLAEGRGDVDDAGAVGGRDEIAADDEVGALVRRHEAEGRS